MEKMHGLSEKSGKEIGLDCIALGCRAKNDHAIKQRASDLTLLTQSQLNQMYIKFYLPDTHS